MKKTYKFIYSAAVVAALALTASSSSSAVLGRVAKQHHYMTPLRLSVFRKSSRRKPFR